jgi:hypothetical protein
MSSASSTSKKIAPVKKEAVAATETAAASRPLRPWECGIIVVAAIALIIGAVYYFVTKNRSRYIPLSDTTALNDLFFGGAPSFALCVNSSAVETSTTVAPKRAMEEARGSLEREGVVSFVEVDCDVSLPKWGVTLGEKFRIKTEWYPAWFFVANGEAPIQLAPALMNGGTDSLVKAIRPLVASALRARRIFTIRSQKDVASCVGRGQGGCLLALSSRPSKDVAVDLAPILTAYPSTRVYHLDIGSYNIALQKGSGGGALLKESIAAAREKAREQGYPRGELLLHFKRPPASSSLAATSKKTVVMTVGFTALPGQFQMSDVERLFQLSKSAGDQLSPKSEAESAAAGETSHAKDDSLIDRLLERDDALDEVQSAIVEADQVILGRAGASKAAKKAAAAASDAGRSTKRGESSSKSGDGGGAASRQRASSSSKTSKSGHQDSGIPLTPEQAQEEERRRQQQRREDMERESAESGHIPFEASEDDGGGGGQEVEDEELVEDEHVMDVVDDDEGDEEL